MELAVALGIFLFLSAVIALAVARGLGTTAEVRAARSGEAAAADALAVLATYPYDQLVSGEFTVPNPCPGTQSGVRGESCVRAGNQQVQIQYEYMQNVDGVVQCSSTALTAGSLDAEEGYVGLCAWAANASGNRLPDQVTQERTVNSPGQTANPYTNGGWVRAFVGGNVDLLPDGSVLYLVKAGNPSSVVATAPLREDNTVVFAVPEPVPGGVSCDEVSPCALALSPTATPTQLNNVALFGPASRPGARIVAQANQVVNTSADLNTATALQIEFAAVTNSANGEIFEYPRSSGNVCLWLTFDDGGDTVQQRVCNTSSASSVNVSTYSKDGITYPLPASPVTISTDNPNGTCESSNNVCTSWTWGPADNLPATVTLNPDQTTRFTARWSPTTPAGGYSNLTGTWAAPRATPQCAISKTCSPAMSNPEDEVCPGELCLSGAGTLPSLISPAGGFVVTDQVTTEFTMQAAAGAQRGVWAYMGSLPTQGTLRSGGSSVATGQLLASTSGSTVSWNMSFQRSQSVTNTSFNVRLCPQQSGDPFNCSGGATQTVRLVTGKPAGTVQVSSFSVAQGSQTSTEARVLDVFGDPIANTPVEFAAPGITFTNGNGGSPSISITDGNGVATITVRTTTSTPAGTVGYTATAVDWNEVGRATVTVVGVPRTVLVQANNVTQGQTSELTATALDANDQLLPDIALNVSVNRNGQPVSTVYAEGGGCLTGEDGRCSLQLRAVDDAEPGSYQVVVTAGSSNVSGNEIIEVTAALGGVELDPAPVLRAGQQDIPFTLAATDKGGNNPGSITLNISAPDGINVPSSVNLDSNGQGAITLGVNADVAVGEYPLTFSYGDGQTEVALTVTAGGYQLQVDNLRIAQGQAGSLQAVVTTGGQMPVGGALVRASSTTPGIVVESRTSTDSEGLAQPTVNVSDNVPTGNYPITVQVEDPLQPGADVTTVATVTVSATPATFLVTGTVPQSQLGGAPISVFSYDGAGQVIGNLTVQLSTEGTGLQVGTGAQWSTLGSATAGPDGKAVFLLRDTAGLPSGPYPIELVADGVRRSGTVFVTATAVSINVNPVRPVVGVGQEPTDVTFTVTDAAGDPVPAVEVTFGQPQGTVVEVLTTGAAVTDNRGQLTVGFLGPQGSPYGPGSILVQAGSAASDVQYWVGTPTTVALWNAGANNLWPLAGPAPLPDLVGNADFDTDGVTGFTGRGNAEAVELTNGAILNTSEESAPLDSVTQFTAAAWVKPSLPNQTAVRFAGDGAGGGFTIEVNQDSSAVITLPAGSGQTDATTVPLSTAIPADQWVWVTVTFDSTTRTLSVYLDGQLAGQSVAEGQWFAPDGSFIIGSGQQNGLVQDASLWTRELTAAQVSDIYQQSNQAGGN